MIFSWGKKKPQQQDSNTPYEHASKHTRSRISAWMQRLWGKNTLSEDTIKDVKQLLITADVGPNATRRIIERMQTYVLDHTDPNAVQHALEQALLETLPTNAPQYQPQHDTEVVLLVGVNGVGKTTTCAKLAFQLQQHGFSTMLAAGDTFRAAAIEQLTAWSNKLNIPVIAQQTGADSASVLYDAFQAAKQRNKQVLIADTAGRLQNKHHLMEELGKIQRVLKKIDNKAPHQCWLVLDASLGQNGLEQAKKFHEHTPLSGVILTKMDGTAKGGVVFSIYEQLSVPIRYIGVGEKEHDLIPFDAQAFVAALITPDH